MALFKKSHSRAKPIVETNSATAGTSYSSGEKMYTISLMVPGGPPYSYFEIQLSEAEMLSITTDWLATFSRDYRAARAES